jgi:O-antigen ligase
MAEAVSSWWDSRLARTLDLLALLAATLVLVRLVLEEDLTWIAVLSIFALVVSLTAIRWPSGALVVLIGMSAMPVYFVEISGWKARPEHFAAGIVLAAVLIAFAFLKHRASWDRLDYWILAYLAINFISSAFASSAPSSTLRWALQNSLAVLPYFLIRFLVRDLDTFRKTFRILLAVGLAECIYGILCYASHQIFGTTAGVQVGQYFVDVAAPYGSMYEPNLFGAYTACCASLFLTCYLFAGRHLRYLFYFLIASLAAVLSFSRAALAALVITTIWIFWKARHANTFDLKKLAVFAVALTLIVTLALALAGDIIIKRFTNLYYEGLTEETAIARFIVFQEALMDIPGHVFFGNGTASFNLSFDWASYMPQWAGEKTWIGNAPLRIVHDTGLIGLTAILGFFVTVWRRVRKITRAQGGYDAMLLGLLAGILLYSISFQSTDGTILAFFWVHLGFLASAVILGAENLPAHDLNNPTAIE